MTLYAKWTADIYTITFDSQDATTNANPTSKTVTVPATTVDALPTAPEKTGNIFGGWFTEEAGSGSQFIASTVVTGDMTVYAKWTALTYTVLYVANGATSGEVPSNQAKIHGVDLTLASNTGNLSQTDYIFAGWNTQSDGSGTRYAEECSYTANVEVTLYAN